MCARIPGNGSRVDSAHAPMGLMPNPQGGDSSEYPLPGGGYFPSAESPYFAAAPQRRRRPLTLHTVIWQVSIICYMTFGKSFATIGVAPLFVAEPLLAYCYLRNRGRVLSLFLRQIVELRALAVSVAAVFVWGMIDVVRPWSAHTNLFEALRTSAFDYYPLFIFAGIGIGQALTMERFLRFWKIFLVFYVVYTIAYYAIGLRGNIVAPWGEHWPLLNLPSNAPFAPLMLLSLWGLLKKFKLRWIALVGGLYPMLESTGRGDILGFVFGLVAIGCASKRHRALIGWFSATGLALLTVFGPLIPGDNSHSENLDPFIQVARMVATVDSDAAYNMLQRRGYHEAAEGIWIANGTAEWRKAIWRNSVNSLSTPQLQLMGQGHGAPLVNYVPDGQNITTPHNFVIFALFYTGAVGVLLFVLMLTVMVGSARKIRDPHVWAMYMSMLWMTVLGALTGNILETPFVAVPFYLICGMCLGVKDAPQTMPAHLWRVSGGGQAPYPLQPIAVARTALI